MGDFKKNPKTPFEVRIPNKIRKRIAMHETKRDAWYRRLKLITAKILSSPTTKVAKKRGSLWSRFTSRVASILQIKPSGVRK